LKEAQKGNVLPFTLEFDDPLDNCFVLNPNYPNEDPKVMVEIYKRTAEQDEDLGFNYLKEN
jgi:hypothetical protein